MPKDEARKAFLEYKRAVQERHDVEDAQIMRGYRELARGRQIINITNAMHARGQHDNGMPKEAVCRADERWCCVETSESTHSITFDGYEDDETQRWSGPHRSRLRRVRTGAWETTPEWTTTRELRAMVPIVPPALRPGFHLRNFHILWEAEWQ